MDNHELLERVRELAAQGSVQRDELLAAYERGVEQSGRSRKGLGVADVLSYIGGGIVFLGIVILLAQNWLTLSFGTRVLATLGAGIASYIAGVLLSQNESSHRVGLAFHLIAALTLPIGLGVVFDHVGWYVDGFGVQSLISGVLLAAYLISLKVYRRDVFSLFSIVFGTWFFFALTNLLVGDGVYFAEPEFSQYRLLIAGLTYMVIAYGLEGGQRRHNTLISALYAVGLVGFLGSALALGGFSPDQNVFWEVVFPGLAFGALFMSIYLHRTSFLTFGTIFLMIYILKITGEYFSTGLGWPLALVLAGLALMGVGYFSVYLKRKYMPAH